MNNLLRDHGSGCLGIDRHVNSLMIFIFLNSGLVKRGEAESIEDKNKNIKTMKRCIKWTG